MIDKSFETFMSNTQNFWVQEVKTRLIYLKSLLAIQQLSGNFLMACDVYRNYLKSYHSLLNSIDSIRSKGYLSHGQRETLDDFIDTVKTENLHLKVALMLYKKGSENPENNHPDSINSFRL